MNLQKKSGGTGLYMTMNSGRLVLSTMKKEYKVKEEEWMVTWMLLQMKKIKGLDASGVRNRECNKRRKR